MKGKLILVWFAFQTKTRLYFLCYTASHYPSYLALKIKLVHLNLWKRWKFLCIKYIFITNKKVFWINTLYKCWRFMHVQNKLLLKEYFWYKTEKKYVLTSTFTFLVFIMSLQLPWQSFYIFIPTNILPGQKQQQQQKKKKKVLLF